MPEVLTGTSGYSYERWLGGFYPAQLPQADWLAYYAERLPAVEINNTFYRMPKRHVVENWRDAVPDGFRFVIKASRRISHQQRLKNTDEATGYLVQRARALGDKLAAVLVQLPPNLPADADRLHAFQTLVPADIPLAFEFRHPSWAAPRIDELLAARGHARVVNNDDADTPIVLDPQAASLYVRLRADAYDDETLRALHRRIRGCEAGTAYAFFKHESNGPALARRLLAIGDRKPPRATTRKAGSERKPASG